MTTQQCFQIGIGMPLDCGRIVLTVIDYVSAKTALPASAA